MKAEYDEQDKVKDQEAEFPHKFNLITREFNFELYSKSAKERDIWVEAFCRAIESKHKKITNWS